MSIYPEALDALQERVLIRLGPVATRHGFYLAGGTAIALHLGHRLSVDFDWFTGSPVVDPMRLAQMLRDEGVAFETGQVEPGTLHGIIEKVAVSFFEYRYPLLEETVYWPENDVALASLDDLACMKLVAIAERGARKDFVDLYALITHHRPLDQLIDLYREKYAVDDVSHLLYALSYFDDAEQERMPVMHWDDEWTAMKAGLQRAVRDVAA